jgi:hypothetical protein
MQDHWLAGVALGVIFLINELATTARIRRANHRRASLNGPRWIDWHSHCLYQTWQSLFHRGKPGMVSKGEVLNPLAKFQDPELGRSIVDPGKIRGLKDVDARVVITLALTKKYESQGG